jgi:hypothetical protein
MLVMHEALPDCCAFPFLDKPETPSFSALLRLRELVKYLQHQALLLKNSH